MIINRRRQKLNSYASLGKLISLIPGTCAKFSILLCEFADCRTNRALSRLILGKKKTKTYEKRKNSEPLVSGAPIAAATIQHRSAVICEAKRMQIRRSTSDKRLFRKYRTGAADIAVAFIARFQTLLKMSLDLSRSL